jgi:ANTAR domain
LPQPEANRRIPQPFLLERTIQLQTALDSRIVIEEAKAILAERESPTPTEAFHQGVGTPAVSEENCIT